MDLIWLIPLVPAAGAAVNGLVGIRWFSRTLSGGVACASMAVSFGLSVLAFVQLLRLAPDARAHTVTLGTWIPSIPLATAGDIGYFEVPWAFRLDPLSALMILVVTGIGLLIHIYATAYMRDEPRGGYARFFCYMNLFCSFMLTLVLGASFLVLFVGWEGVGLCSYLLIGFWYEKTTAADAGKKAFLTNRIGDCGLLLGIMAVFFTFGTLDFRAVADAAATMPRETAGFGALSLICILLFAGAAGKSAQLPLHVWLPDAMAGPTPVSALIHAATMVTAGVYLVARNAVLFEHAPLVLRVVAVVGALTALMAATVATVQTDIKRVLAYSTVSQLGYMFLATGVGAFAAAIFHLLTHAFFKALLFLGSGSVIHALAGEQDMRRMGGLKPFMPVTFVTMMVGTLAIAGIPPFAGFFSKDEILLHAFGGNRILWVIAAVTSLLTAFYMMRLMVLTFYGPYRGTPWTRTASSAAAVEAARHGAPHPRDPHAHGQAEKAEHDVTHGAADAHADRWHGPHESPRLMTSPMVALALGAVAAGLVGIPAAIGGANAIHRFLEPSFAPSASFRLKAEATSPADAFRLKAEATSPADAFRLQAEAATSTGGFRLQAEGQAATEAPVAGSAAEPPAAPHLSHAAELALMAASVLLAVGGILLARHFYLTTPGIPQRLAASWRGVYGLLLNKYYVDELYDATFVRGTLTAARGLWLFDNRIVDGAVNAWAALAQLAAWSSHMFDKHVVDGLVNGVGWSAQAGSGLVRRLQTGLIQNYALVMAAGVFVFLTVYLFAR